MFFFLCFHGSLKRCLMPWQSDYWRSGCHPLGGVFSRFLCALGFLFTLDLYLQFICLLPLKGWQPIRVLPRSPFGIPWRPPCPALSKYQQSSCFTILGVYEYFSSIPSPSVLENWVFSSLSFGTRFWVLAVSAGFFRTYLTFNFLARFHFSVSYSASVKGTVANSMLFNTRYYASDQARKSFLHDLHVF